jgi:uncharacterized protein YcfJ
MKKNTFLALGLLIGSLNANAAEVNEYARVIEVREKTDQVNRPRRECVQEPTTAGADDRGYAGAIVGGIAGGLLGSQVGKGNGKVAAAGAGAVAGALVGDRLQNDGAGIQSPSRCYTVNDMHSKVTGYYVTYEFHGQTYTDVVPFRPGDQIRIRGRLTPTAY